MKIHCWIVLSAALLMSASAFAQGGGGSGGGASSAAASSAATPAATPKPNKIDFFPGSRGSYNLPFDSAFTLGIHYKQMDSIRATTLLWMRGHQTIEEAFKNSSQRNDLDYHFDADTSSIVLDIEFRYKPKGSSGILKPGRKYKLLIAKAPPPGVFSVADDKGIFTDFYKVIDPATGKVDSAKLKLAYKKYKKVRDGMALSGDVKGIQTMDYGPDAFNYYYETFYKTHDSYFKLLNKVSSNSDIQPMVQDGRLRVPIECIQEYYTLLAKKGCPCKGQSSNGVCCDSICSVLLSLKSLILADAAMDVFYNGMISLQDVVKSPLDIKKASTLALQKKNIGLSLQKIAELRNVIMGYEWDAATGDAVTDGVNCLDDFLTNVQKALLIKNDELDTLIGYKQAMFKTLTTDDTIHFLGLEGEELDSYTFNFQTRNALYITPVFGYTVYQFGVTYGFAPYLGFQVNFQPLNQNIPFNLIKPKLLLQRFCFTTAWTLSSVASPGKRQDFFGGTSSLITALGFKLSHVLMLNAGALWFKALDPDPYSTSKRIVATPTISLSINLALKDLLNGFTGLIPSL